VSSPVRFRTQDGYELAGSLYAPARAPRRVALLHPGAGLAAARYARFASFLAEAGIATLTYDYRGIGLSRPGKLAGFNATLEDWSEYDCAAAISWLRGRFPDAEVIGIAHSVGALLVGGAANAAEQARLVLIGAHTGYYGDYAARYRLPMTLIWHALMPALTRLFGYFPARRLGLGEDIPGQIALQWARRRSPQLRPAGTDPAALRTRMLLDRCARLERPALIVSISDDAFATAAGTARLLSCYPKLLASHLRFTPADARAARIGHFGIFGRKAGPALWPRLAAAL
jgi:predicted alpha/beta hydrolase